MIMLRSTRTLAAVVGTILLVAGNSGCESSSRKSVRTYEYSEESRSARRTAHGPAEDEGEVTIEDAGGMVSPGDMVSPGRMVPPDSRSNQDDNDER